MKLFFLGMIGLVSAQLHADGTKEFRKYLNNVVSTMETEDAQKELIDLRAKLQMKIQLIDATLAQLRLPVATPVTTKTVMPHKKPTVPAQQQPSQN